MANFPYQFPTVFNSYNMSSTLDSMHVMDKETMLTSTISHSSSTFGNENIQNTPVLDEIPESEHLGCGVRREVAFNNNEVYLRESNDSWELSSLVSQELKHVDQVPAVETQRKRKNIDFEAGVEEKSEKKMRQASTSKVVATTSLKTDRKRPKKFPEKATTGYIHVRARRGEATDSHSLAERARREKISARFRMLQSLVPGCDEITGKPQKLDAVINYVQSLQNQVKILTEKLSLASFMINSMGAEFSADTISTMGNYELGLQSQLQPEVILSEALVKENILSTSSLI